MEAFVRKLYNGRYYVIEGSPDQFNDKSKVVGEYSTRREAIRNGKREGYDIVIRNRAKIAEESKKKSILDKLASSKQRIAEQNPKPMRSLAKSNAPSLD